MEILYTKTGSSGNTTVIQSGSGELLVIDAGIKFDIVDRAICYRLYQAKSVVATHSHYDHLGKVKSFTQRGLTLYGPAELTKKPGITLGSSIVTVKNRQQFEVPGFKLVPFSLIHEGGTGIPCECYGYLIQDVSTGEKMLHCTDTQCIPYSFPPMEYYNLEANYWEQDEWMEDIELVEKSVEFRRMRSHMSVETATDFLKKQDLSKCKEIHLLHLSNSITSDKREQIIPYIKEQIGRADIDVFI